MVEQICTAKSLLDTRPIDRCHHLRASSARLALVLRDELCRRMKTPREVGRYFARPECFTETANLRGAHNTVGVAGKIAQCVGVRLPNTVRQIDDEKESADQSL